VGRTHSGAFPSASAGISGYRAQLEQRPGGRSAVPAQAAESWRRAHGGGHGPSTPPPLRWRRWGAAEPAAWAPFWQCSEQFQASPATNVAGRHPLEPSGAAGSLRKIATTSVGWAAARLSARRTGVAENERGLFQHLPGKVHPTSAKAPPWWAIQVWATTPACNSPPARENFQSRFQPLLPTTCWRAAPLLLRGLQRLPPLCIEGLWPTPPHRDAS